MPGAEMDGSVRAPDRDAKIHKLLPLVRRIAQRLVRRLPDHVEIEELIATGYIAAIHCVDRFDPSQASSFKAYATTRIHGAMIDLLREMDPVGRNARRRALQLREVREEIKRETGKKATREEVANRLGLGMNDLDRFEMMAIEHRTVSMHAPLDDEDEGSTLEDVLPDEMMTIDSWFTIRAFLQILRHLPPREAELLRSYMIEGKTFREIGERFGVTEARISQLFARAMRLIETQCEEPEQRQLPPQTRKPKPLHRPTSASTKMSEPTPTATPASLYAHLTTLRSVLSPPSTAQLLLHARDAAADRLAAVLRRPR